MTLSTLIALVFFYILPALYYLYNLIIVNKQNNSTLKPFLICVALLPFYNLILFASISVETILKE